MSISAPLSSISLSATKCFRFSKLLVQVFNGYIQLPYLHKHGSLQQFTLKYFHEQANFEERKKENKDMLKQN